MAVRGGGGAVSASIRRRRAGCLHRPPPAAPHRRSDGAPASPLCYSAPRACRVSVAGTPRASRRWAFVASCSAAGRRCATEWDLACAALNLRRLRALGGAAASNAGRPRGEPAVRDGAARERGRRRSAYEAPHGSVAPGPVSHGAESKRRRCPRSRARQSRGTLLLHAAQRLGLGLALLRIVADAEAEPRAGRDPLAALLALGDMEEDRASFVVVEEAEALLGEEAVDDADPALLGGRVGSDPVEDGELGLEGRVGRGGRR